MLTAAPALGPIAAIAIFGGVPVLISLAIALVASYPARRRRRWLRREIEARRAANQLAIRQGAGSSDRPPDPTTSNPDALRD